MRTGPDVVSPVDRPRGKVAVDGAGSLVDPADWSRGFALRIADQEGTAPSGLHWDVFAIMRACHRACHHDHGIAADARVVLKVLGARLGLDKESDRHGLFELFPCGFGKPARKMAGMGQPRAWSTGSSPGSARADAAKPTAS